MLHGQFRRAACPKVLEQLWPQLYAGFTDDPL